MKYLFRFLIIAFWVTLFFAFLKATSFFHLTQSKTPTLNLFSWPEILNPDIIKNFEKETGIRVIRHYYTSNEELLVKLKASQGKGYDLIIPSDYAVAKLIEEKLLQPLSLEKLNFIERLNPKLMDQSFDPKNTYSIPFTWEVSGFGIDRDQFQAIPFEPTWQELFSPTHPNAKISMLNDPIEVIDITAHYLFGAKALLKPKEITKIYATLRAQKPFVEAYAGVRGDYLLMTKNASIALIPSSYILRNAKNYPHIDFVLPKEYCFLSIENMCIPRASQNQPLVYRFLNYLYQIDVISLETKRFQNFPAITYVPSFIQKSPLLFKTFNALNSYEGKFFYTRRLLSEKESRILWIALKAS